MNKNDQVDKACTQSTWLLQVHVVQNSATATKGSADHLQ
jgi:hypothetical protein